jgi:hypothetical protein
MVQSYLQMQFSLMDQLHAQEFLSLLVNVLRMLCEHVFTFVETGPIAWAWLLARPNIPSFCLSLTQFLQGYIFISVYHIPWLHIFHNVNVVMLLMIWVSICYVVCVGMNELQPMLCFEIPLQLSCWRIKFTYKKVSHIFPHHTW